MHKSHAARMGDGESHTGRQIWPKWRESVSFQDRSASEGPVGVARAASSATCRPIIALRGLGGARRGRRALLLEAVGRHARLLSLTLWRRTAPIAREVKLRTVVTEHHVSPLPLWLHPHHPPVHALLPAPLHHRLMHHHWASLLHLLHLLLLVRASLTLPELLGTRPEPSALHLRPVHHPR